LLLTNLSETCFLAGVKAHPDGERFYAPVAFIDSACPSIVALYRVDGKTRGPLFGLFEIVDRVKSQGRFLNHVIIKAHRSPPEDVSPND
jgi:hypothetical protein